MTCVILPDTSGHPENPLWYRVAPQKMSCRNFANDHPARAFRVASPTLPIRAVAPLRDVNDRNEGLIVPDIAIDAIIERRSDRVTASPRYSSRDR